ncbi:MAG: hypothetical protein ACRDD1_03505, partial [Planctomycetia bacterium]
LRQFCRRRTDPATPLDDREAAVGDEPVSFTLSSLETPSSRLACRMQLHAMGVVRPVAFHVKRVQRPDPRVPRGRVKYQVWTYKRVRTLFGWKRWTTEPLAAVPTPGRSAAAVVAALAAQPFHRGRWYDAAGPMLLDRSLDVVSLLGTMVHPPPAPEGCDAWVWLPKVQTAAALCLARLDPEVPWGKSQRRRVLLDLARGPLDWTVEAAVVALTELAHHEDEAAEDVFALFNELIHLPAKAGWVCLLQRVVVCYLQLPGLRDRDREALQMIRKALCD